MNRTNPDSVFQGFLKRQFEEGMALAAQSDLLDLIPQGSFPPDTYIAQYTCKGLVMGSDGSVQEAVRFLVGIHFPADYLRRRCHPPEVILLLEPVNVWHPNVSMDNPFICPGLLQPGTTLVQILYQVFEILSFKKVNMRENDALNKRACSWCRQNIHRFPIDKRPLKRRTVGVQVARALKE